MRIPLTLIFVLQAEARAAGFDTSALAHAPPAAAAELQKEDGSASERLKPVDLTNLDSRIEGFTTVVRTARSAQEKARFLTTVAVLSLQKGRAQAGDGADASGAFARAAKSAEQILRLKKQTRSIYSYAHYLAGLAHAGLRDDSAAEKHLVAVLNIWPQAPYAGGVALHLADLYAQTGRHEQVLGLLKKAGKSLSAEEGAQARLKLARSHAALKQLSAAEDVLKALARDAKAEAVRREAIKDLAFVATQAHKDPLVALMADELFLGRPEHKTAFLSSAWANLQKSGVNHQSSRVFAALIQMAGSADKRLRLWVDETRANRQTYASMRHYSGVYSLEQEFITLPPDKQKAVKRELGAEIVAELEMLMRAFGETYAGREQNQEKIESAQLSAVLKDVAGFYLKNFAEAGNRPAVYALWLDLCAAEKDPACRNEVASMILADQGAKGLHARAGGDRLAALVELEKGDTGKWGGKLVGELEQYVANPQGADWPLYAAILAQKYGERRQFDKALVLLEKLYQRERNEETYVRLQQTRVAAGRAEAAMNEVPPPELGASSRAQTAWRSAVGDHLAGLMQKNEGEKVLAKLLELDGDARSSREISPVVSALALALMRQGQFQKAAQLVPLPNALAKSLLYESVIARLGAGAGVGARELLALAPDKRKYVFQLLALSRPAAVISFLESQSQLDADLVAPCLLALQVKQQTRTPELTGKQKLLLGMRPPKGGDPLGQAESLANEIDFPANAKASKVGERKLRAALKQVRRVRELVEANLQGRGRDTQQRVLAMAVHLEEQAAASAERGDSPESAAEFRQQADAFKTRLLAIEVAERAKSSISREPAATAANWPWPESGLKPKILAQLAEGRVTAALLMTDLNRERGILTENDHHIFHAGILLVDTRNDILQDAACDELKLAGLAVPKVCGK